jgi:hypothetical protein
MKMKKLTHPAAEFQSGQVWRMGEDRLQIEVVGKWLIHYRHFKGPAKRLPTCFASKGDLEQLLMTHKAVLVQDKHPEAEPVRRPRQVRPARKTGRVSGRCSRV